jgi:hypothetical protein
MLRPGEPNPNQGDEAAQERYRTSTGIGGNVTLDVKQTGGIF